VENYSFPKCLKCKVGDLVPLSDFGSQGAAIHYKAWVCTNPECGFNLKIRNGDIYLNESTASRNAPSKTNTERILSRLFDFPQHS